MTRAFFAMAALSLALTLPGPIDAQSLTDLVQPEDGGTAGQSQPPRPTEPVPPPANAQSGGGLSTGVALADGGVATGESYERGTYGDWTLTCVKTGRESEPCRLSQDLQDQTGGTVARIEIFPTNEPGIAAGAALLAPLGTLLPRGVRMAVIEGTMKAYPFLVCNRESCISEFGLLQTEIDAMKAGSSAEVIVVAAAAPDAPVLLTLSFTGFTAAYGEFETLTAGLF